MKTERDEIIEKLDIIDQLVAWSSHTLIALRDKDDNKAAESLDLIIAVMENPQTIKTLKEIRDWAMIPF
jgi:hypothetical protein